MRFMYLSYMRCELLLHFYAYYNGEAAPQAPEEVLLLDHPFTP